MSVAAVMSRPRRAVTLLTAAAVAAIGFSVAAPAAHAKPSATELEHQMDNTWNKLETAGEKYKQNAHELKVNEHKSAKLSKQIKPLAKKVGAMYKDVGRYATAAYKGGNVSAMNSLLAYGSPTTMLNQVSTLDRMASQQHREVAKYVDLKNRLDKKKKHYDNLVASNKADKKRLSKKKKSLQGQMHDMQIKYQKVAANRPGGEALPDDMPYVPGPAGKAVRYAEQQLGKPYVWDTAGPDTFDCSGLTMASWAQAGVHMRHYTYSQYSSFPHVAEGALQPGDLVFYNGGEHVGIYVGKGYVIHAPTPGENVKVSPLNYPGSYYGAVRP